MVRQYNDVTILFYLEIIVNDNGSLGGDRLLVLTKLGIGLGFGRTFLVLLEEGRFYSTGFEELVTGFVYLVCPSWSFVSYPTIIWG